MKLGAAVVGLGVGEAHARAFKLSPQCDLRCVADIDPDRARVVAASLGCEAAGSLAEVLRDPSVNIVSIASFDDAHTLSHL